MNSTTTAVSTTTTTTTNNNHPTVGSGTSSSSDNNDGDNNRTNKDETSNMNNNITITESNDDIDDNNNDSKFAVPHTPNDNKYSFESISSNNNTKRNSGDYNFLHPPTTPSARYSNSFENLNTSGAPPRTPERTPQTLLPEGTPLLSPTSYHHNHGQYSQGLTPGSKRKSIDFYNLLKSPEVRNNALFQQSQSDDPSLKKRSFELHKITNGSSSGSNGIATSTTLLSKSPERSFIFHDNNHTHNDLTGSPKKHINLSPYRIKKKNDAEIKEISENLKARLNYAALKVQNGWGNKSIEELEKVLEKEKEKEREQKEKEKSDPTYDAFWKSQEDKLVKPIRLTSTTSSENNISPKKNRSKRLSLDAIAHAKLGSAENALVTALSPQKISSHGFNNHHNPPSISIDTKNISSSSVLQQPNENAEHEAIISLMSLSSPVKKYDRSNETTTTTTPSNNQSPIPSPPRLQFSKAIKLENPNDYKLSAPPHLSKSQSFIRDNNNNNDDEMMVDDDVTDEEEHLSDNEQNNINQSSNGLFNNQLTHTRTHSHPNSLLQHSLNHNSNISNSHQQNPQPPLPSFSSHSRSRSANLESPQKSILQLPPLNKVVQSSESKNSGIKLPPINSLASAAAVVSSSSSSSSSQPQQLGLGLVSQNQDFQSSLNRKNDITNNYEYIHNDDDEAKTASDYSE